VSPTFESLSSFPGGKRIIEKLGDAEIICNTLDDLKYADLNTILIYLSSERASRVNTQEVIDGTHYHMRSEVDQRIFHQVEGVIHETLEDVDFLELSPVQPLGTNVILANTNQKNIISTLRKSEVLADVTTSLFRHAIADFAKDPNGRSIRIATNTRVARSQAFDPETRFLPHFKMFGQVTVGQAEQQFGPDELVGLIDHLASEVAIIEMVSNLPNSNIQNIEISLGNILFIQSLIEDGVISHEDIRKQTINPAYDVLVEAGIDLPESIQLDTADIAGVLRDLGFKKGVGLIEKFVPVIRERHPQLLPRIKLDLSRFAGIGYYKNLCYRIQVTGNDDLSLPLADGGTTRWAQLCDPGNKNAYTIVSGIGTELLCRYFVN